MPAPKKISSRKVCSTFRLYCLIAQLDFSSFRSRLPRGTSDEGDLYYPPEALLKALIVRQLLNLTYRDLEALLKTQEEYRLACGFPKDYVPDYTYYCKFFTALDALVVEEMGIEVLKQLSQLLDIHLEVVALDSSPFKAWANSFKKGTDPDAKTGKASTKGWFLGYKVHFAVDAKTELPVAIIVTPGNAYDGHHLHTLLEKALEHLPRSLKAVTGDKGYDAGYNYRDIIEYFQALPIIPKRGEETPLFRGQLRLDQFLDGLPPVPPTHPHSHQEVRERAYRTTPPLARDDPYWKNLYDLRLSAERAISRFKGSFCPERLRTRCLSKVKTWCLLGWMSLLASALFLCQQGMSHLVRSFPYIL